MNSIKLPSIDIKKYGGRQVGIVNGEIIAVGNTLQEVIAEARKQVPHKPLQEITFFIDMSGKSVTSASILKWKLKKFLELVHQKFGLRITEQAFLMDAELALKRLDAVRGLLPTDAPGKQDALFMEIHDYFDNIAYDFLRKRLVELDTSTGC